MHISTHSPGTRTAINVNFAERMSDPDRIADQFVSALTSNDGPKIRELSEPGAVWWINLSPQDQPIKELCRLMALERQHVREIRLVEMGRVVSRDGFALRLKAEGTTQGGTDFEIPLCYVVSLRDGRIARFDEYSSADQARPLIREIFGRGERRQKS
jgi:ketosteroid isomerase-like protein